MYSFFIEQIILSIKFGKRDEKINMGLQNESGPKSVAKGSHFMFKFLSKNFWWKLVRIYFKSLGIQASIDRNNLPCNIGCVL